MTSTTSREEALLEHTPEQIAAYIYSEQCRYVGRNHGPVCEKLIADSIRNILAKVNEKISAEVEAREKAESERDIFKAGFSASDDLMASLIAQLSAEREKRLELQAQSEEMREALISLIKLKEHKEKVGKDINYHVWKVDAWVRAGKAVSSSSGSKVQRPVNSLK